jgi:DNA-binding NtrC family response regulator
MIKKQIKLLLVDDEEPIIFVLKQILEAEGYVITACHSAQESIQRFKNDEFAVVLTDVRMAGMDGITMLSKLRKIDPTVQFIIFTAYGVGGDQPEMAINVGTSGFLYKPFEKEELLKILRRAIANYYHALHAKTWSLTPLQDYEEFAWETEP